MSKSTKPYSRKATFKVNKVNNKRVFTAVNKRAKAVCRKAGKRTQLSVSQLKALKGSGSYKFYQYNADNSLSPIKF